MITFVLQAYTDTGLELMLALATDLPEGMPLSLQCVCPSLPCCDRTKVCFSRHDDVAPAMDEIRTYEEVLLQVEKKEELESEVEHTLQMFARKVMQSRMVGGKALRDHFRNYDRNKDNTIDKDEFSDALTSFLSGKDMTQESGEKLESKSFEGGVDDANLVKFGAKMHQKNIKKWCFLVLSSQSVLLIFWCFFWCIFGACARSTNNSPKAPNLIKITD